MKKVFSDVFFYVVIATVMLSLLPALAVYLPPAVTAIAGILLGGVLTGIKMYQTKQAYAEGSRRLVGSRYK